MISTHPVAEPPSTRSRTAPHRLLAGLALIVLASTGCTSVKPWQKETHALIPMQAKDLKCQRFERNVEAYREGAVGANGGKSGGGCGCS